MNMFSPVKYFCKENILLSFFAFFYYSWPPPLVRHAKGILFASMLCKASKVVEMGVLPRTKTPSMSVTSTGLYDL